MLPRYLETSSMMVKYQRLGRSFISLDVVKRITHIWHQFNHDGHYDYYIATENGSPILVDTKENFNPSIELKKLADQIEALIDKSRSEEAGLEERMAIIEKKLEEIYNAPGMPGAIMAQIHFEGLSKSFK